jgi:glycosyltransferase involved in cell wall biosynthesis
MAKTIVVCSNVYPPQFVGGAELIAHCQAKLLKERGDHVIVFAGENNQAGKRYSIRQDFYEGLPVFRVCLHPEDYQLDGVNFSHAQVDAHFATLLDTFAPDVVHLHNVAGLSAGIIPCAKRRNIKTVLTLHDYWGFCFKNTLLKTKDEICQDYTRCAECLPFLTDENGRQFPIRMRQEFLKLRLSEVDVFISPSLYLAERYIQAGIPEKKMKVIWNGVDIERFSSLAKKPRNGKIRYTFIGYFGFHKGLQVLIEALHRSPHFGKITMNLVGGGDLLPYVREQVRTLGLDSIVKFWGKVGNDRIGEVLSETDVLVVPSIWPENQPVSITEAMAAKTPVIASAIGGIPELVIDGYNGYLFPPGSAEDLTAKMSEFVCHPERITTFGENGFQIIKDKSLKQQVEKIRSVYD